MKKFSYALIIGIITGCSSADFSMPDPGQYADSAETDPVTTDSLIVAEAPESSGNDSAIDESVIDSHLPDMADSVIMDTFANDTTVTDTAVADTAVMDTYVTDTNVVDTATHDTFAPDTFSPCSLTASTSCKVYYAIDAGFDSHYDVNEAGIYINWGYGNTYSCGGYVPVGHGTCQLIYTTLYCCDDFTPAH